MIGIDEFKGNSGGEKFHGILTDLGKRKVIDILKTRYEHDLCDYFKKYDRAGVKYFVGDMYKPYAENWFTPITNSFFCPYTNGFTEGCNNKIMVLKRNAYGLQDFKRFRNRILFMFSHQGHNGV